MSRRLIRDRTRGSTLINLLFQELMRIPYLVQITFWRHLQMWLLMSTDPKLWRIWGQHNILKAQSVINRFHFNLDNHMKTNLSHQATIREREEISMLIILWQLIKALIMQLWNLVMRSLLTFLLITISKSSNLFGSFQIQQRNMVLRLNSIKKITPSLQDFLSFSQSPSLQSPQEESMAALQPWFLRWALVQHSKNLRQWIVNKWILPIMTTHHLPRPSLCRHKEPSRMTLSLWKAAKDLL